MKPMKRKCLFYPIFMRQVDSEAFPVELPPHVTNAQVEVLRIDECVGDGTFPWERKHSSCRVYPLQNCIATILPSNKFPVLEYGDTLTRTPKTRILEGDKSLFTSKIMLRSGCGTHRFVCHTSTPVLCRSRARESG